MRLYIGKNHDTGNVAPVQSIFRLVGNDEDALTYGLGFLLAHDPVFCTELLKYLSVTPRRTLKPDYSVHLQEVAERGFGRRDVVIEGGGARIVFEAKVGGAEPTVGQLVKYAKESNLWKQYNTRAVVSLTQVELSTATVDKVRSEFSKLNIHFYAVQWHQVVEGVLKYRYSEGPASSNSAVSRYLFDEFIRYIRRDYRMGYYDAEVHIQDVNRLNAEIYEKGWMYVTVINDKKAPLYFAPYFTNENDAPGISVFSRVKHVRLSDDVPDLKEVDIPDAPSEHRKRWCKGLSMICKRAKDERWEGPNQLFFLDRPVTFRTSPLTKKSFNAMGPSKRIPNQIPKGFSLGFDELLRWQA